jgi:dienelactone hydrolase
MNQQRILESWKEIATYLRRNVRTCQMWEKDHGLPIHRLEGSPRARVFAYVDELDRWFQNKLDESGAGGQPPTSAPAAGLPTLPSLNIALIAGLAVLTVAAIGIAVRLFDRLAKVRWANDVAIPEIERLLLSPEKTRAYALAERAERILPASTLLARLMPLVSGTLSVETDPDGAAVFVRPYGQANAPWRSLGRTPVRNWRLPLGPMHWRVERAGYAGAEGSADIAPGELAQVRITLDRAADRPAGMVRVTGEVCLLPQFQIASSPAVTLEDFWIDRYEVSNRDYQAFVDAGGYADPRYWKHAFERDGRPLAWSEAVALFVDRTGRPGPATWAGGAYPPGRDEDPVTGVSWYEAAAYAEYAGKRLPSAYHWNVAAGIPRDLAYMIPVSNFDARGPAPRGAYGGLGGFGTYDMAGNAKEWCSNKADGQRVNFGGGWNEAQYAAFAFDHYPPMMRSENFGFRCLKEIGTSRASERAHAPLVVRPEPDYAARTPCSDDVFEVIRSHYAYAPTDLEARPESRQEWSPDTVVEKVSFLDPGHEERIVAYLFLPKATKPPFQSVVYVPGSSAMSLDSIFDYVTVKSREVEIYTRGGRAVVFPVLWNTFERRKAGGPPRTRQFLRERMVRLHRELARTVDYLETRPDFDAGRIAYQGLSWGAYMGPILVALDKRFRAANFIGGGFYWEMYSLDRGSPEWDTVNFAPRVKVPLLMQNGELDAFYPLETNAKPLFRIFGTPEKDKRLIVYPTGHSVWLLNESRKDFFAFLDRYLGPVAR